MNVVEIMERFPDQESCMRHLEKVRWGDKVICPRCESEHVGRRNEVERGRIGRWNCYDCRATFKATDDTIFHSTKTPLQKWFLAITLMANAKKSLSSFQLGRDIGVAQKTCWRIMMAIRTEMAIGNPVLEGIVEADETYIGGKKRKNYDRETGEPQTAKRGRGTAKDAVLGAVARDGHVVAELVEDTKGETISEFIKKHVKDIGETELYTDQFRGYNAVGREAKNHETLNRSEEWLAGEMHTNTIEGFWSFVKRAWYGQHHHYSTGYTPLYLAEACYKYNYRSRDMFAKFIEDSLKI